MTISVKYVARAKNLIHGDATKVGCTYRRVTAAIDAQYIYMRIPSGLVNLESGNVRLADATDLYIPVDLEITATECA